MKVGDMVRFAKWGEVQGSQWKASKHWHLAPKKYVGILVEHDKTMGTASVLYHGEIYRVRHVFVQKAGKKDYRRV